MHTLSINVQMKLDTTQNVNQVTQHDTMKAG